MREITKEVEVVIEIRDDLPEYCGAGCRFLNTRPIFPKCVLFDETIKYGDVPPIIMRCEECLIQFGMGE